MGRKRVATLPVFFSLLLVILTGCDDRKHVEIRVAIDDRPTVETIVTVSCPDARTAGVISAVGKSWEGRRPTYRIRCIIRDGKEPEAGDLWVLAPSELPKWAAKDSLKPVPPQYLARGGAYDWDGVIPLYRDRLDSWGTGEGASLKVWALPIFGEAPVCCYRSDIFPDRPPTSWEELERTLRAAKPNGKLAPLPLSDEALTREFLAIAVNYVRRAITDNEPKQPDQDDQAFSLYYDFRTGEPRIAGPGFIHALKWMQKMRDLRGEPLKEPEQAFMSGDAAFCYTDASWVARFQSDPASKVRGLFGVCPIPGAERLFLPSAPEGHEVHPANHIPFLGSAGFLGVVPAKTMLADEAFDLLATLSGKIISLQLFQEPSYQSGPIRESQLSDETRWDSYELDRTRTSALRYSLRQTLLHPNVRNPAIRLRIPDQKSHQEALAQGLRAALKDNVDAEKALQEVANQWKRLDEANGKAKHLAEYRQSLGLFAND